MAEDGAVGEQEQDSPAQEDDSKLGRLKSRVKELVGTDSADAEKSEGDDAEKSESEDEASAESGSDDEESQGAEEGSSSDEETSVSTDDVELSTVAEDEDTARAQIDKMEEDGPPENLGEWPRGKAMYLSFGGAEGEQGYEEGPAKQMGPSSLRHHADGSVEVKGEKVDNPEDYKGEKSVGEEAEEIGMDKGAKSEGDDEESSGEDGAQSESSGEGEEQTEGSGESNEQSESSGADDAQASSSEGDASADDGGSGDQESQGETAETS